MKNRTLNEIRQSKEYQQAVELSDQGGKYTVPIKGADPVPSKNPFDHDDAADLADRIADKLQPKIFEFIFESVNDEMSKHYTFQDTNYLTEAGLELFEDEWFEFYHEYNGRIIHKLLQNLK